MAVKVAVTVTSLAGMEKPLFGVSMTVLLASVTTKLPKVYPSKVMTSSCIQSL